MMEPSTLIAAAIAFIVCLALVPAAKKIATRIGLVDKPDKKRKLHEKAIPLAGGVAIFVALCISVSLTGAIAYLADSANWFVWKNFIGILAGGALLLGIGVYDDRFGMRGRTKLIGQMLAVSLFLLLGTDSYEVNLFGLKLSSWVGMPLIAIWLIGAINAVNLIDGADGMASTVGGIASIALTVMAIASNASAEAVVAAAMSGAILAFLIYNFPPATVFLGDAGSMLIGFLVGAVAVNSSSKDAASLVMIAPVAVIVIPLFDSFVAILRRRLTGRSIYTVDRGHIHHAMMANGYGPKQMLMLVGCLSLISAVGGTLSTVFNHWLPASISVSLVIGFLVLGRVFGFAEFALLKCKVVALGSSFLTSDDSAEPRSRQKTIRLQGSRNWDQLWDAITEFAEEHSMAQVRLDLNLPWLHEGYHATWQRPVRVDKHECWKTSLPLSANGQTFGRLEIVGPLSRSSVYVLLSLLSELLESMEPVILRLANEDPRPAAIPSRVRDRQAIGTPVESGDVGVGTKKRTVASNL